MTKDKTGGPAYPRSGSTFLMGRQEGKTLRDWFAGQALVGLSSEDYGNAYPHGMAKECYEIADAMIEERDKG